MHGLLMLAKLKNPINHITKHSKHATVYKQFGRSGVSEGFYSHANKMPAYNENDCFE